MFSIPDEVPSWISKIDEPFVLTPLNITVMRRTHDGMLKKSKPTIVIVVEDTVCDALTVYVPVLPVPVPSAVMVVPAVTPVPVIT